jgi:hypothetical protein
VQRLEQLPVQVALVAQHLALGGRLRQGPPGQLARQSGTPLALQGLYLGGQFFDPFGEVVAVPLRQPLRPGGQLLGRRAAVAGDSAESGWSVPRLSLGGRCAMHNAPAVARGCWSDGARRP